MTQPDMKSEDKSNVPMRQFSLYRPPYEELYTFWWKCMQITLHDKGTQTLATSADLNKLYPEQDVIDPKATENDQLKQLMAMVSYYNTVGREGRSKVARTFRGAGALAPGLAPSMLAADPPNQQDGVSSSMDTTPVMEERPTLFSDAKAEQSTENGEQEPSVLLSTPILMSTPLSALFNTPTLTPSPSTSSSPDSQNMQMSTPPAKTSTAAGLLSPSFNVSIKKEEEEKKNETLPNSNAFEGTASLSAAASLSAVLLPALTSLSQPPSHFLSQLSPSQDIPLTSSCASQTPVTSPSYEQSTQPAEKTSPVMGSPLLPEFTDSEQLFNNIDAVHIKQLTDVLGRKGLMDTLSQVAPSISSAEQLSNYLSSGITMAQAASILTQLPPTSNNSSSNNRSILGSLGSFMPALYSTMELKTDGYSSTNDTGVKTERGARHYPAADTDTSNITLPEGFEVEEHLTWSEVEGFVNEFKTKRVKLGYTQAHVGAALALVHGPEFSQTTISRFEGLQLSFPNHKKIIPILRRWLESVENPAKRRHHSPNGLHGSQNGNSKRRKRTTISSNSKEILEQYYQTNPLPSTDEIGNLSNNLALDKRVIRIWFQNRRAIGKRLSKLIVTMGGGASRNTSLTNIQPQAGLY